MNIEEIRKRLKRHREIQFDIPVCDFYQFDSDVEYLLSLIDKHEVQSEQFEQFKKERREMIELMVSKGLISADQYLEVVNEVLRKE